MKNKILICEDDADILELLEVMFSSKYQISSVQNVEDVLELVEKHQPELILMDIWIPPIGGEAAVKVLKSHPQTRGIPVVFVSANDKIEKITERANADAFLRKPFNVEECRNIVRRMLGSKSLT